MSELRNKLSSVFGEKLNRENPLPEHPRPQFKRAWMQSLNGEWIYRVVQKENRKEVFRGKILVPFSP